MLSDNPEFFDFVRKALGKRLRHHVRTGTRADERTVSELSEVVVEEAAAAGVGVDMSAADREDVVSRVCAYFVARPHISKRRVPTASNKALWEYLAPLSRRIALKSARANGGVIDRAFLAAALRARVEVYYAEHAHMALDDDAGGIIERLVAYRAQWRLTKRALKPAVTPKPGATEEVRRALDQAVFNLVTLTSGPDPAIYAGLHKARPSRTLSLGRNGHLRGRTARNFRPSVSAIHQVLSDHAVSQNRQPSSRSAVGRAIRKNFGAPDRDARLSELPAPSRRIYHVLTALLPDKRISAVRDKDLAEKIWGEATCASTLRGHRKRLREAVDRLTSARINLNATVVGEVVIVGRGRKLPSDLDGVAGKLKVRTLDPGRVALRTGIWSSPQGEAAKAYLRLVAQQAGPADIELLERFQGNEVTGFARAISRANPKLLEDPIAFLEEVARAARHVLHHPTITQSKLGAQTTTGWPEAVAAAEDLLAVVQVVNESDSLLLGWRKLSAGSKADPTVIKALEGFIAEIRDPDALDAFLALAAKEVEGQSLRNSKRGIWSTPPAR